MQIIISIILITVSVQALANGPNATVMVTGYAQTNDADRLEHQADLEGQWTWKGSESREFIFSSGMKQFLTHENRIDRQWDWLNPSLRGRQSFQNGQYFLGISGIYGLSEISRKSDFVLGIGPEMGFRFNLNDVEISQQFQYRYQWYRYDVSRGGLPSRPHQFASATRLGYDLGRDFKLGASFHFIHEINVYHRSINTSLSSLDLGYPFADQWHLAAGYQVSVSTLNPNGSYERLVLNDPRYSLVYLSLSFQLSEVSNQGGHP